MMIVKPLKPAGKDKVFYNVGIIDVVDYNDYSK
jgi:hypothetical protein